MGLYTVVVRAFALLALITGAADVVVGLSGQELIGAALSEGYGDPLLNSQIRYLGAIWFGFGWLLWHCTGDIERHAGLLQGAFWIVFLGGVGRVASVFQFGFPASGSGTAFVIFAIAVEIVGMPLLALWAWRLAKRGR